MPSPLAEYLEQFRSSLKGLPQERCDAEVEEMRQHLEFLIQQRVDNGYSEEVAISIAIRQFGSARTLARATRKTWQRDHLSTRRESMLRRIHLLLALILLHSIILQLLASLFSTISWYYFVNRLYYPLWLPPTFKPDWVAVFFSEMPSTFNSLGPLSWPPVSLFFLAFAVCSLRMPQEMRTTFFGVFSAVIGSFVIEQAIIWSWYLSSYGSLNKIVALGQALSDLWRVTLFLVSSWGLCVSLARDKSLVSQLNRHRAI